MKCLRMPWLRHPLPFYSTNSPEHSLFLTTLSVFILNTKSDSYNIKETDLKISYTTTCPLLSLLTVMFYIQIQCIHFMFLSPVPVFPRTHYSVLLPPLLPPFSPINKLSCLQVPLPLHTSLPPADTQSFPFASRLGFSNHCHHFHSLLEYLFSPQPLKFDFCYQKILKSH